MSATGAITAWLLAAPRGPVEDCGATALLTAISGAPITAMLHARGPRELTAREQDLLQAPATTAGHERRATLYAGPVPAAATTAILLPDRIPPAARAALGIGPDHTVPGATPCVPLGRALAGLGVRREPLEVQATPGRRDTSGREQVISSIARLWLGGPIALVTEDVYREFLDACPAPPAAP